MIFRRWSMLTATAAITGGIIASVVAIDVLFVNDPYLRPPPKEKKKKPTPPEDK